MVESLHADAIGLKMRVNEYEDQGLPVAEALDNVYADKAERYESYCTSGRQGGSWLDNDTLIALARLYHFDALVLDPDASFTDVEELTGHSARHVARIALLDQHYRALIAVSSDEDVPTIGARVPLSFFNRAAVRLEKRREWLEAVLRGEEVTATLEPMDRAAFLGRGETGPVATRATAQGGIQQIGRAQARLALARSRFAQPAQPAQPVQPGSACPTPVSPVSPAAAPSPVPPHSPHSPDSPTSWTPSDIDALVQQFVDQAQAIPSVLRSGICAYSAIWMRRRTSRPRRTSRTCSLTTTPWLSHSPSCSQRQVCRLGRG